LYDVNELKRIVVAAGKLARGWFQSASSSLKEDDTCLTEADLTVQAYIQRELEILFPNDGLLAEEANLRRMPRTGSRTWVVDPIDGTAAFIAGLPLWGTSIALVENSEAKAGFFYMPITEELFYTAPDGQVFRNNKPVHLKSGQAWGPESCLLVGSRFHQTFHVTASFPWKIRSFGSTVAHLCYVAGGVVEAALLSGVHIWDFAAGVAMVRANGGAVKNLDGHDVEVGDALLDNKPGPPMLAGSAQVVDLLIRSLSECRL